MPSSATTSGLKIALGETDACQAKDAPPALLAHTTIDDQLQAGAAAKAGLSIGAGISPPLDEHQ